MPDCLDARYVPTQLSQLTGVVDLLGCQLHAQGKLRLTQLQELAGEFRIVLLSKFTCLHDSPQMTGHERRGDRKFRCGKGKRLPRQDFTNTVHFI